MTLDASVPKLAAFIKMCPLSDCVFDPFQKAQGAHYPIKALGILIRKQKTKPLNSFGLSASKLLLKHRNLSLPNTMYENPKHTSPKTAPEKS